MLVPDLLPCLEGDIRREGFGFGSQRSRNKTVSLEPQETCSSETQNQKRNWWAGLSKAFEHLDTNSSGLQLERAFLNFNFSRKFQNERADLFQVGAQSAFLLSRANAYPPLSCSSFLTAGMYM